jgi:hypothetical protein
LQEQVRALVNINNRRKRAKRINAALLSLAERTDPLKYNSKVAKRYKKRNKQSKLCVINGQQGTCLPNFHGVGEGCKNGSFFKGFCQGPKHIQCCIHKSKVRTLHMQYNTMNQKALCPSGYKISLERLKACKYTHGERSPVKPNKLDTGTDNPDGRRYNRRVEIHRVYDTELCNRCKDDVIISHGLTTYKEINFTNAAMKKRCLNLDKSCVYRSRTENKKILQNYLEKHSKQCKVIKNNDIHSTLLLEAKSNETTGAALCSPTCLTPGAKTLWECFKHDYKFYQEKISLMFNLPNTKSAEANTNLLNAWKSCSMKSFVPNAKVACKQKVSKLLNNDGFVHASAHTNNCECIDIRYSKCNLKLARLVNNKCEGSNNIKGCEVLTTFPYSTGFLQQRSIEDKLKDLDREIGEIDENDDPPLTTSDHLFTSAPSCMLV